MQRPVRARCTRSCLEHHRGCWQHVPREKEDTQVIKVLQCHAVAFDDEDDDEDGDDDDDDDDGQAMLTACRAREDGGWMCHTRRVASTSCRRATSQQVDDHTRHEHATMTTRCWLVQHRSVECQRYRCLRALPTSHCDESLVRAFGKHSHRPTHHRGGHYMWMDAKS